MARVKDRLYNLYLKRDRKGGLDRIRSEYRNHQRRKSKGGENNART